MLKWLIYGLPVGTWILEVGFPAGSCGSTDDDGGGDGDDDHYHRNHHYPCL